MYSDNKGNKGNSITDHSFTKMVHNHQRFVKFFILYFLARVTLSEKEVKTEPGGEVGSSFDGLYRDGEVPPEKRYLSQASGI